MTMHITSCQHLGVGSSQAENVQFSSKVEKAKEEENDRDLLSNGETVIRTSHDNQKKKVSFFLRKLWIDPEAPLGDIDSVNTGILRACGVVTCSWVALVFFVFKFLVDDNDQVCASKEEQLTNELERNVAKTAFFVVCVSASLHLVPVLIRYRNRGAGHPNDSGFSAVLVATSVILLISMSTNALLGWGPRAITFDRNTGSRVFLIRWSEWTPLSGFMTLLAESADLDRSKTAWRGPVICAIFQSVSTACGLLLPYCGSFTMWIIVMTVSFGTFLTIFPRVWIRRQALQKTPRGKTVLERDHYNRRRFAYYLMFMCAFFWSILVALYFVNLVVHVFLPEDHFLNFPSLAMSCDTVSDILAKSLYTRIILEAHQAVFDSHLRMARQLNELKQLMTVLWVSSSDVIVISSTRKKEGHTAATTMFSPSFMTLLGAELPKSIRGPDVAQDSTAFVLETLDGKVQSACYVDTAIPSDVYAGRGQEGQIVLAHEDIAANVVEQALRVAREAWKMSNPDNNDEWDEDQLKALPLSHSDGKRDCVCEMKVSRHTATTALAVVRDVTERYRRFEAENRVHTEVIARQRDMHTANRFTRHEVKNGLLSAIELCSALGCSIEQLRNTLSSVDLRKESTMKRASIVLNEDMGKTLADLDGSLHRVLNTVLTEVMAREVVHGVYKPRLEELDIPAFLTSELGMNKQRFPLSVKGKVLPLLQMDVQLLGHIHRNAVSNACKYGEHGGVVKTVVEYKQDSKEFKLQIINSPGDAHDRLLELGNTAGEFVFAQGVRLQAHLHGANANSSGDGAWIMQKCANTMQGKCTISFQPGSTVFTFSCTAYPVSNADAQQYLKFAVPENTWGIGIDDSKIQRRLMKRILSHAGVHPSRQILLGETLDEIVHLDSTLIKLVKNHAQDKFLVIVDEHLDYDWTACQQQQCVYSGSFIMQQLMEKMPSDLLSRCLIVMRSANDSAVDISLYNQRTHGYFPKVIVQADKTLEILAPMWSQRFPVTKQEKYSHK